MKKNDKLIEILKEDKKLTSEMRMEYISIAQAFVDDFKNNINLTSIELDDKYHFGMDTWQSFLRYPPVTKYINSYRNELITKGINEAMITGNKAKDAISVKKEMERENSDNTFENFVVFRLPDKEESYEFTGDL